MTLQHRAIATFTMAITAAAVFAAGSASAQGYWVTPAQPPPPAVMVPIHPIGPAFVNPAVPVIYPHHPYGPSYGQAYQLCQSHALSATSHYAVQTPVGFVPANGPSLRRHFRRCMRNYGY